ncbi:MAG: hypothetical protein GKR91_17110 [Pseudomonadales bacterium]|nr:hypothetical protein [Pseudomonadales bacterium]
MKYFKYLLYLIPLAALFSSGLVAAAESEETYLLLNVDTTGPLMARDVEFTNVDTGETVLVKDVIELGRYTQTHFYLLPINPGLYYLSKIYPTHNRIDASPAIDVDERSGIITIQENAINYIGDVIIETKDMGPRVSTLVTYEANSRTLVHAVSSEREIFERLETVVTIAGHYPVPVDKQLLGL